MEGVARLSCWLDVTIAQGLINHAKAQVTIEILGGVASRSTGRTGQGTPEDVGRVRAGGGLGPQDNFVLGASNPEYAIVTTPAVVTLAPSSMCPSSNLRTLALRKGGTASSPTKIRHTVKFGSLMKKTQRHETQPREGKRAGRTSDNPHASGRQTTSRRRTWPW